MVFSDTCSTAAMLRKGWRGSSCNACSNLRSSASKVTVFVIVQRELTYFVRKYVSRASTICSLVGAEYAIAQGARGAGNRRSPPARFGVRSLPAARAAGLHGAADSAHAGTSQGL